MTGTESITVGRDIPDDFWHVEWHHFAAGLSPQRMRSAAQSAQWVTSFVIARDHAGRPIGLLPIYRPRVAQQLDEDYAPHRVAAQLFTGLTEDPWRWLLLGGRSDLAAGSAVAAALPRDRAVHMRTALVRAATAFARKNGLQALALYVRDEELPSFTAMGSFAAEQIDVSCVLPVAGSSTEDYLSRLTASRRYDMRRDLRKIAGSSLTTTQCPATTAIGIAAPLIVAVKSKHGIIDHPRLAAMRLRRWIAGCAGSTFAILVTDAAGGLVAVVFCGDDGRNLEVYEIGLAEDHPHRHSAYLQAMIYAPLCYAQRRGLATIELGLGSSRPKQIRGASVSPVWAVFDRPEHTRWEESSRQAMP